MDKPVSLSAKALYLALLTRQIRPWQSVWRQPQAQGRAWQELSANLYSNILQPMWLVLPDTDTFLLCCVWDFSLADELYKTGGYVNAMD
jgi:hypothetical protein